MDAESKKLLNKIIFGLGEIKRLIHDLISLPKQQGCSSQGDKAEADRGERETGPWIHPSNLKLDPPIASHPHANQAKQERFPRLTEWKPVIELLGIIIVAAYTTAAYFQWHESALANRIALEHFRRDQRAWLQVVPAQKDRALDDIKTLSSPVKFSNIGKTPAKGIRLDCVFEIVDAATPPSLSYDQRHPYFTRAILFPTVSDEVACDKIISPEMLPIEVTTEERVALAAGRSYITTFGKVEYSDQFGPHWTHFCWWRGFRAGMQVSSRPCVDYNDVDSN